jgi:D-alanine-D-alanine ligase
VREAVQRHTRAAHRALGCRGISRCDFRWDGEKDELVFLEINTQPGMTPTSLIPELGAHAGLPFVKLLTWLVNDASVDRS